MFDTEGRKFKFNDSERIDTQERKRADYIYKKTICEALLYGLLAGFIGLALVCTFVFLSGGL